MVPDNLLYLLWYGHVAYFSISKSMKTITKGQHKVEARFSMKDLLNWRELDQS